MSLQLTALVLCVEVSGSEVPRAASSQMHYFHPGLPQRLRRKDRPWFCQVVSQGAAESGAADSPSPLLLRCCAPAANRLPCPIG